MRYHLCVAAFAAGASVAFGAASDPFGLTLVDLTSPNGTITSSQTFSGADDVGPEAAFNDDETLATRCIISGKKADFMYEFDETTKVTAYGIYNYGANNPDARAPKSWTFSGSNDDGATWTDLDSQDSESGWASKEYRFYYFGDKGAFKKYKLDITANNGNQYLQFARIEFYGVDVADAVPVSFGGGGYPLTGHRSQ